MFAGLQYQLLKKFWPVVPDYFTDNYYQDKSKLRVLLGEGFLGEIRGKTVIDFGCGEGTEAVEMALNGARRVIGIDIQEPGLQRARARAAASGVGDVCLFTRDGAEPADIIVSIDAFEHFEDPGAILAAMSALLKPGGEARISFGPPWFHPLGGHLFSVFPWAHLIFSERAFMRWRSTFKTDGATRFGEVAGGLNQITIARFERLVRASAFNIVSLELVPIQKLAPVHNRLTREFTTAIIRCRLIRKSD